MNVAESHNRHARRNDNPLPGGDVERQACVLIVDDDAYLCEDLHRTLQSAGYSAVEAADGETALQMLAAHPVDLVLLDLKLERSRLSGMDVLRHAARTCPEVPVVVISGEGTIRTAVEATRLGAYDFLEKPAGRERILLTVRNALEKVYLQRERNRLLAEADRPYRIVGSGPAMQAVFRIIDRAAATTSKVLVSGESGTGKEILGFTAHHLVALRQAEAPFGHSVCLAAGQRDERQQQQNGGHDAHCETLL